VGLLIGRLPLRRKAAVVGRCPELFAVPGPGLRGGRGRPLPGGGQGVNRVEGRQGQAKTPGQLQGRRERGCILGSVEVYDCQQDVDLPDEFLHDPFVGLDCWCWLLREPRPLATPYPCKGAVSLWQSPKGLRLV
jgi:hypothetical protein